MQHGTYIYWDIQKESGCHGDFCRLAAKASRNVRFSRGWQKGQTRLRASSSCSFIGKKIKRRACTTWNEHKQNWRWAVETSPWRPKALVCTLQRKSTCSRSEPREELKIKTFMVTVTIALTRKTLPRKVKGHALKLPSHSLPLNAPTIGHNAQRNKTLNILTCQT